MKLAVCTVGWLAVIVLTTVIGWRTGISPFDDTQGPLPLAVGGSIAIAWGVAATLVWRMPAVSLLTCSAAAALSLMLAFALPAPDLVTATSLGLASWSLIIVVDTLRHRS
jgi:hypothetical protein